MRVSADDSSLGDLLWSLNARHAEPAPRLTFVNHSAVSSRASENASRASQSIADDASEERLLKIETQLRTFAGSDDAARLSDIEQKLGRITETLAAMSAKLDSRLPVKLSRHASA